MRNVFLLIAFLASGLLLNAQDNEPKLVMGDIVTLGEPVGSDYRHINFPRKNLIIKRGGIADFRALVGQKLVVQNIEVTKNGATMVKLKRKDGQRFFRFFPSVNANLDKALATKELSIFNTLP